MNYLSLIYMLNFVLLLICAGFLNDNRTSSLSFNLPRSNKIAKVISSFPRETLLSIAIATEEYHNKVDNFKSVFEGNIDYLTKLSDNQLIKGIVEETEDHPEIASIHKLRVLANGDLKEKAKINRERILRSLLKNYALEYLRQCAIKMDNVLEKKSGKRSTKMDLNNKEEIIENILKIVYYNPKFASGYESVCQIFDFSMPNMIYMDETKIKDIMPLLSKEVLKVYCLVFERYDMEHNPRRKSVMEKYLNKLKKRQLMGFLNIFMERYPELNTIRSIEEKRKEYNLPLKIN
jgi:hypothetical protein